MLGAPISIGQQETQRDGITCATIRPALVSTRQIPEATASRMALTVPLLMVLMTFDLQCMMYGSCRVWGLWKMRREDWCLH